MEDSESSSQPIVTQPMPEDTEKRVGPSAGASTCGSECAQFCSSCCVDTGEQSSEVAECCCLSTFLCVHCDCMQVCCECCNS